MGRLTSLLARFRGRSSDNLVDRLNRRHGSYLLLFLASLVYLVQSVGRPIDCWCPAQFASDQIRYANTICWNADSYRPVVDVPFGIENDHFARKGEPSYNYYQWVALFFLLQSFLVRVPHLLWTFILRNHPANVPELMEAADMAGKAVQLEMREKAVSRVASGLESYISKRSHSDIRPTATFSRKRCDIAGSLLCAAYLFVKAIYLFNSLLQIVIMGLFLGDVRSYLIRGLTALEGITRGQPRSLMVHLPAVILCEFEMRNQARIHNYVVQCCVSINFLNEKLFLVLWFWFHAIALFTFVDLFKWTFFCFYTPGAISHVSKRLITSPVETAQTDRRFLSRFARLHLGRDGRLIVRLLACNHGDVTASEVLTRLWSNYEARQSERDYFDTAPTIKSKASAATTSTREALQESAFV